jgi:membrane protein implicated in regulation of membrane protease activity
MYELIDTLQQWYAGPALVALAVVLILIDYYFPTDWPAHLGYFCFAAGMFFVVPLGVAASGGAAAGIWAALAALHQVWFRRFLTNAPHLTAPISDEDIR